MTYGRFGLPGPLHRKVANAKMTYGQFSLTGNPLYRGVAETRRAAKLFAALGVLRGSAVKCILHIWILD